MGDVSGTNYHYNGGSVFRGDILSGTCYKMLKQSSKISRNRICLAFHLRVNFFWPVFFPEISGGINDFLGKKKLQRKSKQQNSLRTIDNMNYVLLVVCAH